MNTVYSRIGILAIVGVIMATSGCASISQLAALKNVKFSLESVSEINLAGVQLGDKISYEDLGVLDLARLGRAIAGKKMPLSFQLGVGATNPADNAVSARMVKMDWTLLLEDRETISGVFDQPVDLVPGQLTTIPFGIELDLVQFFGNNLKDLAELGLSLADQGGAPKNIKIRALPTIETALGPIRYPKAITIVSKTVG